MNKFITILMLVFAMSIPSVVASGGSVKERVQQNVQAPTEDGMTRCENRIAHYTAKVRKYALYANGDDSSSYKRWKYNYYVGRLNWWKNYCQPAPE